MGAGAARLQLATYPQSPFSGPARCCDVTDLYQAFSQRTGPGRLWISLDAPVCCPLSIDRATKKPSRKNQPKDAELQFRPVQSEGSRHTLIRNPFDPFPAVQPVFVSCASFRSRIFCVCTSPKKTDTEIWLTVKVCGLIRTLHFVQGRNPA